MTKININFTNKIHQPPNPDFYYIIAHSDKELPEIINIGWNTYIFKNDVVFTLSGEKPIQSNDLHIYGNDKKIYKSYTQPILLKTPCNNEIRMVYRFTFLNNELYTEKFDIE